MAWRNRLQSPLEESTSLIDVPSGTLGWVATFGIVIAYDLYAIKTKKRETMSTTFWKWSLHPIGKFPTFILWTGLTYHLLVDNPIRKNKKRESVQK